MTDDLQQAIHAANEQAERLREFALHAKDWLRPKMPDGYEMSYSLITLRLSLLKGADALEQLQAAQAENQQLRELLRQIWDMNLCDDREMGMIWCRQEIGLKVRAALEHQAALGQVDQPCDCGHPLADHPPGICTTCGIVTTPNGVKTLSGKCMGWQPAALGQVDQPAEPDEVQRLRHEVERLNLFAATVGEYVHAEELDSSYAAPAWANLKKALAALGQVDQ